MTWQFWWSGNSAVMMPWWWGNNDWCDFGNDKATMMMPGQWHGNDGTVTGNCSKGMVIATSMANDTTTMMWQQLCNCSDNNGAMTWLHQWLNGMTTAVTMPRCGQHKEKEEPVTHRNKGKLYQWIINLVATAEKWCGISIGKIAMQHRWTKLS